MSASVEMNQVDTRSQREVRRDMREESLRFNLHNALIITKREVRDSLRDWRIIVPIVILTLVFPSLAQFAADRFMGFVTDYGAELIGERTIPFLLMIVGFFPISVSLVIALETFVGEKERRSLEPLLATPLSNAELYVGKTLAAMIPPLMTSYGGMAVYLFQLFAGALQWRPEPMLIIQIVLLTTAQALVMVTAAVVISSQTTSTRAANLLASFVIIPMTFLVQLESVIMFFAEAEILWIILVGLIVTDIILIRTGARMFNREEMIGREVDQLNLRWVGRRFWHYFKGEAVSLWGWYRHEVLGSLPRLKLPLIAMALCLGAAFLVGYGFGPQYRLPLAEMFEAQGGRQQIINQFSNWTQLQDGALGIRAIFWQNTRVLLAAFLLGIFTFGVMGPILVMITMMILGYLLAQFGMAGLDPMLFMAALLPHGITEIPAMIIAGAATLHLGAVFTAYGEGLSVGERWLRAAATSIKILLGLVLPLLILSAVVESRITPLVISLIVR